MSLMPWFKMFSESRMDPKLDALNDREFRIWHKLLCLAAESDDRGSIDFLDTEYVAMNLRVGVDELESAVGRMTRLRLVERENGRVLFPAFAKRNARKPSDEPAAIHQRVKRHRDSKKGSNAVQRVTNAPVTPREEKRREDSLSAEGTEMPAPLGEEEAARVIAEIRSTLAAKRQTA